MGSSTIIASGMSSASSATVGTQPKLSRTKETGDSSEILMEGRNGMRDRSVAALQVPNGILDEDTGRCLGGAILVDCCCKSEEDV